MTVADRSNLLNLVKWGLDKLTTYYPETRLSSRDRERVDRLQSIFKNWITCAGQETPELLFLRTCDILGLDPVWAKNELRKVTR